MYTVCCIDRKRIAADEMSLCKTQRPFNITTSHIISHSISSLYLFQQLGHRRFVDHVKHDGSTGEKSLRQHEAGAGGQRADHDGDICAGDVGQLIVRPELSGETSFLNKTG